VLLGAVASFMNVQTCVALAQHFKAIVVSAHARLTSSRSRARSPRSTPRPGLAAGEPLARRRTEPEPPDG
jgi:hypothetical protein